MTSAKVLELLSAVAAPGERGTAAQALAQYLGAEALVLLVLDTETGAFVPAPGMRRTLPGSEGWHALLLQCRRPGVHRHRVDWSDRPVDAVACSGAGIAGVLIGGQVEARGLELLGLALPLLASALSFQQAATFARGELAAAQTELVHAATLTRALDTARRQVDQTLVELDARGRALEAARKRAEQAARAKDEFLAMLGHELRNPLAPIVTALELTRQRGGWSPEHDIMRRQVEHVMRLVDDLLDVSRIASGKLTLALEAVPLASVIGQAVESVQPLMDPVRPPIGRSMPPDLYVRGDRGRLVQVFSNLLTNALKYSDASTAVDVTARITGDTVVIDVLDRGIGLEQEDLETVFGLFEQRGRGIDRSQGGLGLGLAIVSSVVELHGGRVRAESAGRGQGSRFTVELPVAPGHPESVERTDTAPAPGSGRVLLVDDNRDAASTLAMALELSGYEVRTAHDGEEALRAAHEFHPMAAILDIGLPRMNGYELARAMRETLDTPPRLIALTGYGQPSDLESSARAGFDAHLVKPVDFSRLCETVAGLLSTTPSRRPHLHPG